MKILLVEDNTAISKGLNYTLTSNNFECVVASNIMEAKSNLDGIDLVILDVTLPDGNGFDFYENNIKNIPTIFLTAKDDEEDIVKGLNLGAEDYITKPFRPLELIARINRILNKKKNAIKIKNIKYDLDKMEIYKNDELINLTSLEKRIVNLLFLNINKIVSRATILDKIWEWTGNDVDDHTLTVYLKRIREKIDTDIIKTIKGIGYRIDEE